MNYRGQMVFLGEDGRFIQGPAQQIIREADSRGATFLYGATAEDLALCADGLVREIAGGKVLRFDDLKRFSSIVTEIPEGLFSLLLGQERYRRQSRPRWFGTFANNLG